MSNCLMSIHTFGARKVTAVKVAFGLDIHTQESHGRTAKVIHTTNLTEGDFDLTLAFRSRDEYVSIMEWLESYMRWIAEPSSRNSPVRVVIPVRDFDKTGVLKGGVVHGEAVSKPFYSAMLGFTGAIDTLNKASYTDLISRYDGTVEETVAQWLPGAKAGPYIYGWDSVGQVGFDFGERRVY